jgi:hypothetical protein
MPSAFSVIENGNSDNRICLVAYKYLLIGSTFIVQMIYNFADTD